MKLRALVRNWWSWSLDYVYVTYWQVRGVLVRSDPGLYAAGIRPPVLLLPGIWENWQFLQPLAMLLHDRGHPVHVVQRLGWNLGTVVDAAAIAYEYILDQDLRDVTVLAHSKGGLIGKYMMIRSDIAADSGGDGTGGEPRITRMVAVAAPFNGSAYARFAFTRNLRDFSPTDATLMLLGRDLAANSRITSIYPSFDPHIPGGSELPGAVNVRLAGAGHFRIIGSTELANAVLEAMGEEEEAPDE